MSWFRGVGRERWGKWLGGKGGGNSWERKVGEMVGRERWGKWLGGKGGENGWEGKVGEIVPCQDLEDFSTVVPIFFEY